MPSLNEQDLKKQIKENAFSRVYLIYGEEGYLKSYYVNLIASKSVQKGLEEFNLHRFDGKEANIDMISDAVEALPMMSKRTCTVVKDMPLDALSASESKKFKELLDDPPESSVLIFWMDAAEVNARKSSKWKTVINQINKCGAAVELEKRSLSSITKLLTDGAKKRGCVFQPNAAQYLVSVVGDDLNILLNELEKLCSYVGEGEITKEHIDTISVKTLDAVVFDLSKALVKNEYDRAYMLLDRLLAQKEEPVSILAALSSSYIDMYRAKVAVTSGMKAEELAKVFNYRNKEFRLKNAARDAAKLSIPQIRDCIDGLSNADLALKGSRTDKRLILEQLICRLLLISNEV